MDKLKNKKKKPQHQENGPIQKTKETLKIMPCLYLVNILTSPPPKSKYIVDNLTTSHMNNSKEKYWKHGVSFLKKPRYRKDYCTFLSKTEKDLEAKAQTILYNKKYRKLMQTGRVKQRREAAIVIQSFWRMCKGIEITKLAKERREIRSAAASTIQKFIRAYFTLKNLKQYLIAVVIVQKLQRGRCARVKIWKEKYYPIFNKTVRTLIPGIKTLSKMLQMCNILRTRDREIVDDGVDIVSGGVNGLYFFQNNNENNKHKFNQFQLLSFAYKTCIRLRGIKIIMRKLREQAQRDAMAKVKHQQMAAQHAKYEKEKIAKQMEKNRLLKQIEDEKQRKRLKEREQLLIERREKLRLETLKKQEAKKRKLKEDEERQLKIDNEKRLRALATKDRINRDRQMRMDERAKKKEIRRLKRFQEEEAEKVALEKLLKQKALNKALGIVSPKIPKTKRLKEEAVKRYWAKHEDTDALDLLAEGSIGNVSTTL